MNEIIELIQSYVDVSTEDAETVAKIGEWKTFEKNEYIFTPAQVCQHVFIMTKGLVRCFYVFGDKEINLRLLCEQSAVIAYSSYLQQSKTDEYVQAIEQCEGLMLSRKAINQLADSMPAIELLKREIAEQHYLSMERRLLTIQYKTAEERLEAFQAKMDSGIVSRTPAIHVASYLGMAPESLSRAKRQLNKC